jgi:hypothetical protein
MVNAIVCVHHLRSAQRWNPVVAIHGTEQPAAMPIAA